MVRGRQSPYTVALTGLSACVIVVKHGMYTCPTQDMSHSGVRFVSRKTSNYPKPCNWIAAMEIQPSRVAYQGACVCGLTCQSKIVLTRSRFDDKYQLS
jgi:hypothetical protein